MRPYSRVRSGGRELLAIHIEMTHAKGRGELQEGVGYRDG